MIQSVCLYLISCHLSDYFIRYMAVSFLSSALGWHASANPFISFSSFPEQMSSYSMMYGSDVGDKLFFKCIIYYKLLWRNATSDVLTFDLMNNSPNNALTSMSSLSLKFILKYSEYLLMFCIIYVRTDISAWLCYKARDSPWQF